MIHLPAARAAMLSIASVPVASFLGRELLLQEGVALTTPAFLIGVVLPVSLSMLSASLAYSILIGRRGVAIRDAMRRIAEGDLATGVPAAILEGRPDLLGIRHAFEKMRLELDRALKRLAHADAQRRRLFADLAHELATPASALLALTDTIGAPGFSLGAAEERRLFEGLEGETLRIARLVEDIRDLAELDDPDVSFVKERADVAEVVESAVARFSQADGAKIEGRFEHAYSDIDALRIDQVIANLVRNAKRHTPSDRRIFVSSEKQGDFVCVIVEDEGPGVPQELLAKLGERLFRVGDSRDRRNGGHGLGLSIVRAIASRHGGSVDFTTGDSGGLKVTLRLPAV